MANKNLPTIRQSTEVALSRANMLMDMADKILAKQSNIDPTATIDPSATIHEDAVIKAYVIIGANVEIDSGTVVESHAVIHGPTKIGKNNHIYSFASIGGDPQDITYEDGQESNLIIGNNNIIREFCTINRGTEKEESLTRIGSNNMLMAYVHIAHDCQLGNHIIMYNNASLAGHVRVYDGAVLGGFTLVKQFCRIGAYTYMRMGCHIYRDVPPYMVASPDMTTSYYATANAKTKTLVCGVNMEGMKRRGFSSIAIASILRTYRLVYHREHFHYGNHTFDYALCRLEESEADSPEVLQFVKFIRSSKAGVMDDSFESR